MEQTANPYKKPLILVVEDNPGILLNLRTTLEFNNYEVKTARNGKEALEILNKCEVIPDLILSDILMPEVDGIELYMTVSQNPIWSQIPFFFLTAVSDPENIRSCKMLGVDDYITKPFKDEDLLAAIAGKIIRNEKSKLINKKLSEVFSSLKKDITPSVHDDEKKHICLIYFVWDETIGPKLVDKYPENINLPISIEYIGTQLFNGAISIYGQTGVHKPQGVLVNIDYINMTSYIFFDSIPDPSVRGGYRRFMLAVISPKINYFESIKINKIFTDMSKTIKDKEKLNYEKTWMEILKILSIPYFS